MSQLDPSRREFLKAGSAAVALGAGLVPVVGGVQAASPPAKLVDGTPEWRNRQPGMAYRRLGRTNLMISEVVAGGDPITLENYKHLELALEMGLNYLDMAPAYNKGDTERAYGKLLAGSSGRRDKVFLTTKVSDFTKVRDGMYEEILKGLPAVQAGGDPPAGQPAQGRAWRRSPGLLPRILPRRAEVVRAVFPPGGDAGRVRAQGRGVAQAPRGDRRLGRGEPHAGSAPITSTS